MNVYLAMNESQLYTRFSKMWDVTFVTLFSSAFVLSDWSILYSSFGDFILAFILLLLIGLKLANIDKKQFMLMLFPFTVILVTSTYSYFFYNHWFHLERIVLSSAKVGLYLTTIVLFYNYIKKKQLEWFLLRVSSLIAIGMVFTSIVIVILIHFEISSAYNFIWRFTRTDELSYTYGNSIIRARGLFSEPAHLGYYLNTIFFANIFSKYKKNYYVLNILTIGVAITFSYSMIAIYVSTGIVFMSKELVRRKIRWSHAYIAITILLAGLIYLMREYIYEVIIQRTANILSGADGSAYNRLVETWMWVDRDRILFGNLIGHTPPLTNIYAYMLSDFGLLGFIPYVLLTLYFAFQNIAAFVLFVGMNAAKGGYLNPALWLFIFYFFLYGIKPYKLNRPI